jgi:hypothetical protein
MRVPMRRVQCTPSFVAYRQQLRRSKCCAARTLCYISRIDAKCLEMANVQGNPQVDVHAASPPQGVHGRGMHVLPGFCEFSAQTAIANVFMERIA